MSHLRWLLIVVTVIVPLQGCGGGGGSSNVPNDPSTIFSLFPAGYFSPGYSESYTLSGTDTNGRRYTASQSRETQSPSTFNAVAAIPVEIFSRLEETASGSVAVAIGTEYYSTNVANPDYLGSINTTDGITLLASTTTAYPETATIGDFGAVGTYTDNVGETDAIAWRLDDGGNGNGRLVISTTTTGFIRKRCIHRRRNLFNQPKWQSCVSDTSAVLSTIWYNFEFIWQQKLITCWFRAKQATLRCVYTAPCSYWSLDEITLRYAKKTDRQSGRVAVAASTARTRADEE